jgi:hypothetical protein
VGFLLLWSLSGAPVTASLPRTQAASSFVPRFLQADRHLSVSRQWFQCRERCLQYFAYATIGQLRLLKFRLCVPLNNYKVLIAAGSSAPYRRW